MSIAQTQGPQVEWNGRSSGDGKERRFRRHRAKRREGRGDGVQDDDRGLRRLQSARRDVDRLVQVARIDVLAVVVIQRQARIRLGRGVVVVMLGRGHRDVLVRQRAGDGLAAGLEQYQRPGQDPYAEYAMDPAPLSDEPAKARHDSARARRRHARPPMFEPVSSVQFIRENLDQENAVCTDPDQPRGMDQKPQIMCNF